MSDQQPVTSSSELYNKAIELLGQKKTFEEINTTLAAQGNRQSEIEDVLKKIKKEKISKRVSKGFTFILIGASTLLLSCILTFGTQYNHYSFTFVLYGLTTAGACFVMTGLAMVFG